MQQQNNTIRQDLQESQKQQETRLQAWKQDLEEKISAQIQDVRLEQESRFKQLEQPLKKNTKWHTYLSDYAPHYHRFHHLTLARQESRIPSTDTN